MFGLQNRENDLSTVNVGNLGDIREVVIDQSLPCREKKKSFLNQVDPCLYRYEDIVITAVFDKNGPTMEYLIVQHLLSKVRLTI